MTTSDPARPVQNSLASDLLAAARYFLGTRFGLLAIAALALGLGAYSSWGWLVAAGLAPLLLTFAPCAIMCALGLCSMSGKSKSATDAISSSSVDGDDIKLPLNLAAAEGNTDPAGEPKEQNKVSLSNRKGCC